MEKKEYTSPYDFEGKIPLKQAVILGLQHVLAMFVGNLTPVLIITGACAAMHDADVFAAIQVSLLQNAMLIAGVVTLVQLFNRSYWWESPNYHGNKFRIYWCFPKCCSCNGWWCFRIWCHHGSKYYWWFI